MTCRGMASTEGRRVRWELCPTDENVASPGLRREGKEARYAVGSFTAPTTCLGAPWASLRALQSESGFCRPSPPVCALLNATTRGARRSIVNGCKHRRDSHLIESRDLKDG